MAAPGHGPGQAASGGVTAPATQLPAQPESLVAIAGVQLAPLVQDGSGVDEGGDGGSGGEGESGGDDDDDGESGSDNDGLGGASPLPPRVTLHRGVATHHCRFCAYTSKKPDHVVRHERVHTGEKPYLCSLCDYSSARATRVQRHLGNKHSKRGRVCTAVATGKYLAKDSLPPLKAEGGGGGGGGIGSGWQAAPRPVSRFGDPFTAAMASSGPPVLPPSAPSSTPVDSPSGGGGVGGVDLGLHPTVRADQVVSAYATRQSTGRGSGRRRTPQGSPASEGDDGAGDGDSGVGAEGWTAGGDHVLQSAGGPRSGKKKRPAQGRPSTGPTGSGTWDSCSLHCAPTLDVTMRVLFVVMRLLLFCQTSVGEVGRARAPLLGKCWGLWGLPWRLHRRPCRCRCHPCCPWDCCWVQGCPACPRPFPWPCVHRPCRSAAWCRGVA